MKVYAIFLACVIAYVSAQECTNTPSAEQLAEWKCSPNYNVVFSGQTMRGMSSQFNDGPYTKTFSRHELNIIETFKGQGILTSSSVWVYGIYPTQGPCGTQSIGGTQSLVFAFYNTTADTYRVFPCVTNPALECVGEAGLNAFRNVAC